LGDRKDVTPSTPGSRERARSRSVVNDPLAERFTRPPATPRDRMGRTPPPAERRSVTPVPGHRSASPSRKASRPKLSELLVEFVNELGKNWRALVIGLIVAVFAVLIVAFHAVWCYSSLPIDHYVSTEARARRLAPGFRWEGSRYGLFSAMRCPSWEAASFRLVGRARGVEEPLVTIMCCTAEAQPSCTVLTEP
jgi:hypothetical protein